MVDEILTAAGVKYRQNRFVKPPRETYAVWAETIDSDGADGMPLHARRDHRIVRVHSRPGRRGGGRGGDGRTGVALDETRPRLD